MRDLKFRAWTQGIKWVEMKRTLYKKPFMTHFEIDELSDGLILPSGTYLEDSKLMQYAGLLDKNDKEIFEGDIIKYYDSHEMWLTGQVIYADSAFAVTTDENSIYLLNFVINEGTYPIEELEIIGNIYENSELLKELT